MARSGKAIHIDTVRVLMDEIHRVCELRDKASNEDNWTEFGAYDDVMIELVRCVEKLNKMR